ncbi:hypothetical protein KFE96_03045 [Kordiimonas sp. SCSIO 12603]|uniref:BRcat domain-containing protein n=1 Tax=Kordiimonas sp. SCSIO 12603 TaxID=2829596 RepID=UPI0021082A4C|nr:hypothetical protein [Kordiimonas sp. SCSIO 12603]UTW59300.1 hypothetical protein KFE96_03045 [Kordiimonas sp. SCSIO 12603]
MSSLSNIPNPIDNNPIEVVERKVREVPCPNPQCNHQLDITSINAGTKIKCQNCSNVTWTPLYHQKWWQKTKGFILSLILSLAIGVTGSVLGSMVLTSLSVETEQVSEGAE